MPVYSPDLGARAVIAASRFLGLSSMLHLDEDTPCDLSILDESTAELFRLGWRSQWPYAAAFVEAAWSKAYQGRCELAKVKQMFNPSILQTWRNAVEADWSSLDPQIGAIGVMKNGAADSGHCFIVRGIQSAILYTMEAGGPGMDLVVKRTRRLEYEPNNLPHLLGFILPITESA